MLTRKEAKKKLKLGWSYLHDGKAYVYEERILNTIDQIYDEHDLEMKAKDEEIERLKADIEQWKQNFLDA